MLTLAFPAAAFDTNCYVLATQANSECLIVDPGVGVLDQLNEILSHYRLKPAAVLLTHGHFDHVFSVTPVCGGDTAAYIHSADRYRLTDPLAILGPGVLSMLEQQFGPIPTWKEPDHVTEITGGATLSIAGLDLTVQHAPGHTEGSVLFTLPSTPDGLGEETGTTRTVLSGDVLFAGSIGRTDLAGGSTEAMQRSLREVVLPIPDDSLILPGHGPATTMKHERATNPHLQGLTK